MWRASSISSSHLHRDRRHPRRCLAYAVAAVAIMGLAAETVLLHLTQLSHPPGSYADVSRVLPASPLRRCLCVAARRRALCSAGPPRRLRCRCIAVGSSCLSTVIGGCHRCSLSLPGSAPTCRVGTSPPPGSPLPPLLRTPLNCMLRFSPCPRSQVRVSNRSGGHGPPLFSVFCFSKRPPARPPATPRARRLGPPLTER